MAPVNATAQMTAEEPTPAGAVATPCPAPVMFAGFVEGCRARPPRSRRLTLAFSVAAHVGLAALGAVLSRMPQKKTPAVNLSAATLVVPVSLRQPGTPAPAPTPSPPRPQPPRPRRPAVVKALVQPTPAAPSEPTKEEAVEEGAAEVAATATAAGPAGPSGTPQASVGSGQAVALPDGERQRLLASYLKDVLRPSIARRFRYPTAAERLELTGEVFVRLVVDGGGRLLKADLLGACPHAVLCDDALATVRAAAPFPVPPGVLGPRLEVDVPLKYQLE